MDLQGSVIRPPSEAGSILLQVSLGCTHNKCSFCGAYLNKRFSIKKRAVVSADIDYAARHLAGVRKVFLCDGDVLSLPQDRLESILEEVQARLPHVTRVASYGNARGLRRKSLEELCRLKERGLGMVYMGLESGHDGILARMNKRSDAESIVLEGRKVMDAGLKLNVTVINGLGGMEQSMGHARETAQALNRMQPHQVAALSLMLIPGTSLYEECEAGRFSLPDGWGMLQELREMVSGLELSRSLFLANHASNYLPIRARLPKDKPAILRRLDQALQGRVRLKPESFRAL